MENALSVFLFTVCVCVLFIWLPYPVYTNQGLHWDEAGFRPSETSTFPVHWKRGRSWHNLDLVPYQRLSVSTFTLTHTLGYFLFYFSDFFFCSADSFTLRKLSEERPHVLLNQFPCETVLTTKDCLASVARRARGGQGALWLPKTFNLQTELPQFIRHYLQKQERWASVWS